MPPALRDHLQRRKSSPTTEVLALTAEAWSCAWGAWGCWLYPWVLDGAQEGAGLQGQRSVGALSQGMLPSGSGFLAWLPSMGAGISTGSSPPHRGAKGTTATGPSRCSPDPLLPQACTCDVARPLRDSLQTEDSHWPMDSKPQLGWGQRGQSPKSAWRHMAGVRAADRKPAPPLHPKVAETKSQRPLGSRRSCRQQHLMPG